MIKTRPVFPLTAMGLSRLLPRGKLSPRLSFGIIQTSIGQRVRGWIGGNNLTPNTTTIERLEASNEIVSLVNSFLSSPKHDGVGIHSAFAGYYAGGDDSGGVYTSAIDRQIHSTETCSIISATLSATQAAYGDAGMCGGLLKGYMPGTGSPTGTGSEMRSLTFSTEVSANLGAILAAGRNVTTAVTTNINGYIAGAFSAFANSNKWGKFSYALETDALLAATIGALGDGAMQGCESLSKGYQLGGFIGGTQSTSIRDFSFSAETSAVITAVLSIKRWGGGGISFYDNGYAIGGDDGTTAILQADKFNMPTETIKGQITSKLSVVRMNGVTWHTPILRNQA